MQKQSELDLRIQNLLEQSFLKPYLEDEDITDISYDGEIMRLQHNKKGRYKTDFQPTDEDVLSLGKKIADIQGKEFNNSRPILDTELAYFRVNFIHHAVSPSGCTFAVRVSKPRLAAQNINEMIKDVQEVDLKEDVAKLLEVLIKADMNTIISGRTGAGKTELQKLLVGFIPNNKKITLIEDTMDSHIKALYPEKDINSWRTLTDETRDNKIGYNDLIQAGLRNNPDWLIMAETRGSEAYDMVEAALTDHNLISTIHVKRAKAIPSRLLTMIGQKYQVNELLFGKDIVSVLPIGIYLTIKETENGIERFIREIVEFTDFTEKGAEYITLYAIERDFNEEIGDYEDKVITNPLSDETLANIKYEGLYHMLPVRFKKSGNEQKGRN